MNAIVECRQQFLNVLRILVVQEFGGDITGAAFVNDFIDDRNGEFSQYADRGYNDFKFGIPELIAVGDVNDFGFERHQGITLAVLGKGNRCSASTCWKCI